MTAKPSPASLHHLWFCSTGWRRPPALRHLDLPPRPHRLVLLEGIAQK